MVRVVRMFLIGEAVTFFAAAVIHAGLLIRGFEHTEARIAETVIGAVLMAGAVATWMQPAWTRSVGLAAQGFALLGTFVGVGTIIAGIGPRSALDYTIHTIMIATLLCGLVVTLRARRVNVV